MTTIEVHGLTKRFGGVTAVDNLSFAVQPGSVTGFLGPNGAGKTTTLRAILALVRADAGTATIGGLPYADLPRPTATVGAVLDDAGAHPARTGRANLTVAAVAAGLGRRRVEHVLDVVELTDAASRRVSGYSLGMRKRLGLATALLGDPSVLVLDEPTNGLDPAGVRWLRDLLRSLAAEGRTVLVSSHLLAEVAHTVDDVVIVDHGRLLRACPLAELAGPPAVAVRAPEAHRLKVVLNAAGMTTQGDGPEGVVVVGSTPEAVGRAVADAGLVIYELRLVGGSLEDAFLSLTSDDPHQPTEADR